MHPIQARMMMLFEDDDFLNAVESVIKRFSTDRLCREYLEAKLWPNGPVCPHCPGGKKVYRIKGKSARNGLYTCGACRKQFTVTVGTIFERSHIPLPVWFLGILVVFMWQDTIKVRHLQKATGISYKSAWSMRKRILSAVSRGIPDDIYTIGC